MIDNSNIMIVRVFSMLFLDNCFIQLDGHVSKSKRVMI